MILAEFKTGEYSTTACGLVQWDYGQTLKITGVETTETPEVHFSVNRKDAVIVVGNIVDGAIEAKIPDDLLKEWETIKAYLYIADPDSGKTIKKINMPVKRRERPGDYTEGDGQNLLRELIDELKKKADNIQAVDGYLQLLSGATPIGDRVRLPAGTGGVGREIELRNSGTAIEWRYTDSNEWTELIQMSELRGKDGETPEFELRAGHLIAIYKN